MMLLQKVKYKYFQKKKWTLLSFCFLSNTFQEWISFASEQKIQRMLILLHFLPQ